ncbi:uncharacterized protein TNCV_2137881 [Trichonephila clavipes]|nr:uncharacterized protein TNCV_2137881 [Trichonephila clavipes]
MLLFDGTWLTRGHSSQIGVGCVIDLLTGFVMDFLKLCQNAALNVITQNLVWEKIQQNFMCGMKRTYIFMCYQSRKMILCHGKEAALKLWQRSEDSGFRYTTLLSDGDAKTYQYLNTKEVYVPEIKIKKEKNA